MFTIKLWHVEVTPPRAKGERKDRVHKFVVMATSQEEAKESVRAEHFNFGPFEEAWKQAKIVVDDIYENGRTAAVGVVFR